MTGRLAARGLLILDRDGVINRDSREFVKNTDEWLPIPGSIEAIADLSKAGYTVTVASNQSGLARGLFDRNALRAMHRKLRRLVDARGGHIDRIVVCPTPILVRTGNGKTVAGRLPKTLRSVPVFDDLAAAADGLLKR